MTYEPQSRSFSKKTVQKLEQPFVVKEAGDADPVALFKFWVEINDQIVAEFKECNGLRLEREAKEITEGGLNERSHYLAGRNKYSRITLKYGLMRTSALWDWYQEGMYDLKVKRLNFSIKLYSSKGEVVKTWNVLRAFPVKWEGPALNVESNQVAIETLEIVHHGLKLDTSTSQGGQQESSTNSPQN
jgi:phage tail-like protein